MRNPRHGWKHSRGSLQLSPALLLVMLGAGLVFSLPLMLLTGAAPGPVLPAFGGCLLLAGLCWHWRQHREALAHLAGRNEIHFCEMFERLPAVAVHARDAQGRVVFWNAACEQLYGFSGPEALGQPLSGLIVPPAQREAFGIGSAGQVAGECSRQHKDGHLLPVFSSQTLLQGPAGVSLFYCVDVDLSALKQAQTRVRLSEAVFNDAAEGILVTDADNRIVSVNDALCRISGFSREELIGCRPSVFASGRHDYAFYAGMWRSLLQHRRWHGDILNRKKNGELYPAWLAISTMEDEQGAISHFVAIVSDLSERQAYEEQLEFVASHDPLTGLPNRVLLQDRANQALLHAENRGGGVALAVLDLDHFKLVNDSLGQSNGDVLLRAVVERLQRCLGRNDTLCRQGGGDEFLLLLSDCETGRALEARLTALLQCFAQPFVISGQRLPMTASLGVALAPDDANDFGALLQRAETAMHHAKRAGRNTYRFFAETMNQDVQARFAMQARLAMAIERGELLLHYQPQLDLLARRCVGMEALLRWQDGGQGLVSPASFIPVAEDSGLIVPIGEWVLREACLQAQRWREQGFGDLLMAVNMSALQFRHGDPLLPVQAALAESGLPPHCLELELTESILIEDADAMLQTLLRLKALGVQLAIDDFGTGYSSLAYLKRFPIDKLKIDQSFVRELPGDEDDAAIVRAIIQLGHSLKMTTLAEGVESAAQLGFLRIEGCSQGQGYLFSRPLAAADCPDYLARHGSLACADGAQARVSLQV